MLKIFRPIRIGLFKLFGVTIKKNVIIKPGVVISKGFLNGSKGGVTVNENCELSRGVILKAFGGQIVIGTNTFLGEYVVVYGHGGVEIGDNTLIAMHTCIVSSNHEVPPKNITIRSKPDILMPVKIGRDVWIGAGCKILGGVTIGDGCVIGAGAVVTKSLPPYAIAMGLPAKITGYRND
jgi:acetyltransferase-like isoleucine patch superfamily enzyme